MKQLMNIKYKNSVMKIFKFLLPLQPPFTSEKLPFVKKWCFFCTDGPFKSGYEKSSIYIKEKRVSQ
jgi:hypothetical protein